MATYNLSASIPKLLVALAAADLINLLTGVAAALFKFAKMPNASLTSLPLTKNVRVTPRKVRLVIDLVRGLDVKEALGILANLNKAAATPVSKLIKSAAANATNNFGMDADKLYVATIYANDGLRMKRYMPRAKGSASGLVRRCSHITVVVKMR